MIHLSSLEASRLIQASAKSSKGKKIANPGVPLEAAPLLADLPPYRTEYRFHQSRRWRFDAAWPEIKLAIEFHGGVHIGGRHTRGTGFTKDREKMNSAQLLGWTVLEVTPEHVKSGQLRAWLLTAFNQDQDQTRTNP